jgi:hypothetical protein
MGRLHTRFPDDTEGAIHYALILGVAGSPQTRPMPTSCAGAAILEPSGSAQPEHPGIVHYLHPTSYDYHRSPRAVCAPRSATRPGGGCGARAAHALAHLHPHRPLGWLDRHQPALRRARRRHRRRDGEFHALDYMVYAYLQTGQDEAARRALASAGRARSAEPRATPTPSPRGHAGRLALERGAWAEAAALPAPAQASAFPTPTR